MQGIPHFLKEIPHIIWAILVFLVLCGLWLISRDRDILNFVGTALGAVVGLLTGRALAAHSAESPAEENR